MKVRHDAGLIDLRSKQEVRFVLFGIHGPRVLGDHEELHIWTDSQGGTTLVFDAAQVFEFLRSTGLEDRL